tara:strand:- start:836 stop:1063 length:228 start_codon:yes stop_codon:yes gene_type:complete
MISKNNIVLCGAMIFSGGCNTLSIGYDLLDLNFLFGCSGFEFNKQVGAYTNLQAVPVVSFNVKTGVGMTHNKDPP